MNVLRQHGFCDGVRRDFQRSGTARPNQRELHPTSHGGVACRAVEFMHHGVENECPQCAAEQGGFSLGPTKDAVWKNNRCFYGCIKAYCCFYVKQKLSAVFEISSFEIRSLLLDGNTRPFRLSNSNYEHIRSVEIEIAIGIGIEILVFSSISVPIPIWLPMAAAKIRIADFACCLCRYT
jgi:hypothetical protein